MSTASAHHDVLVVGGGNAGIATAARLRRRGAHDVAVLDPGDTHTYRPLLSYVGAGRATLAAARRPQADVIPPGVTWIRAAAAAIDPATNAVTTSDGRRFTATDLVLCPGLVPDEAAWPRLHDLLADPRIGSNYLDRADETWAAVQRVRSGGCAVFTVPAPPVSCTGTTLKPAFLALDHWRATGRDVRVVVVVDRPRLLDAPDVDARLRREAADAGLELLFDHRVRDVDPAGSRVRLTGPGGEVNLPYDLLHLVPDYRGPAWIEAAGLAGDHGLVDVDPETLRHRRHPRIWGLGDAATVETDPSGGALRRQVEVLVDNVAAARLGRELRRYDGYTVAPVAVTGHRLVAAEFDRSGRVTTKLPVLDPLTPRRSAYAFDRFGLPRIYWNALLRGRV